MANDKIRKNYEDIANAIRNKTGENGLIKAEEMPQKISEIEIGIEPTGTQQIRNNGEFNIREFEKVNVDVPGATTKELFEATANGTYDIAEYANVKVDVPNPSTGTLKITENGEYNVTEKASVNVAVPLPSGKAPAITANGNNINIKDYETVDVNVPIPAGYIIPKDSLDITENGEYNVTEKASVNVAVPLPSGKAPAITENGTDIDISQYASVDVNVPVPPEYVIPTGNINITDTDKIDVAAYATAQVVDANLVAGNIKKDVTILGILGTLEGGTDGLDELMQEEF